MKSKQNLFAVILFALTCCFIIVQMFKIISLSIPVILGISLVLYSIPTLYLAMGKGKRLQIIISALLFFIGLILVIVKVYEVFEPLKVVFPSIIFITGVVFILLYIENPKESSFLYAGIISAVLGIISVLTYKHFALFYFTDRIISFVAGNWHLVLIIGGIILLMNRNKK
jgi:hypothetical protein